MIEGICVFILKHTELTNSRSGFEEDRMTLIVTKWNPILLNAIIQDLSTLCVFATCQNILSPWSLHVQSFFVGAFCL